MELYSLSSIIHFLYTKQITTNNCKIIVKMTRYEEKQKQKKTKKTQAHTQGSFLHLYIIIKKHASNLFLLSSYHNKYIPLAFNKAYAVCSFKKLKIISLI